MSKKGKKRIGLLRVRQGQWQKILIMELIVVIMLMWGASIFFSPSSDYDENNTNLHGSANQEEQLNDNSLFQQNLELMKKRGVSLVMRSYIRESDTISRAEFVQMVVQFKGVHPHSFVNSQCFSDVVNEWFAPSVCYAKRSGWVNGRSDKFFDTEKAITYAEAYSVIGKAFKVRGMPLPLESAKFMPLADAVQLLVQFK